MPKLDITTLVTRARLEGDTLLTIGSNGELVLTPVTGGGSNLVIQDQNLNATANEDLAITLGPLTNNGNTVTYTLTGAGAANYTASTTNSGVFNSSVEGTELINVSGDDGAGGTDTGLITVSIAAAAPVITQQPVAQSVTEPTAVTFSVTATNANSYQWYENDVAMSGEVSSTLTIDPTSASMTGNTYKVDVIGSSTVTSDSVTLTVAAAQPAPVITQQPIAQSVTEPSAATFSVTATNANSYQWYENDVAMTGETAASLTIDPTSTGMTGNTYKVDVIGSSTVTSDSVTLTVSAAPIPAPVITQQPVAQSVTEPDVATFSVTATNANSYQWYENDVAMTGETGATLTIDPTAGSMSGNTYKVDVIGSSTVTSNSVTLTVSTLPVYGTDIVIDNIEVL
jgi:hypothetical protein